MTRQESKVSPLVARRNATPRESPPRFATTICAGDSVPETEYGSNPSRMASPTGVQRINDDSVGPTKSGETGERISILKTTTLPGNPRVTELDPPAGAVTNSRVESALTAIPRKPLSNWSPVGATSIVVTTW